MVHPKARQPSTKAGFSSLFFTQNPSQGAGRFWAFICPFLAFVLVLSYCNIRSLDLWWHLKTGELIWQTRSIPRVDPFSFSAAGEPWISHEWLFGLLSFLTFSIGGIQALVGAKALLIAGLLVLVAVTARVRGASAEMIFLVLAASYAICRFRFTERPELVSVSLAVGFLLIYEISRRRPAGILVLPVLQILWVNFHGGTALLGWALAGAVLLDRACEIRSPGTPWRWNVVGKELRWPLASTAGVFSVSLANPHGVRALFYGLLRTESPLDNKEFQSLRQMVKPGVDQSIVLFLLFAGLLLVLFALRARTVRPYEWMLLFPLLLLTLIFFRFRLLFVFLLGPALAFQLSHVLGLHRLRGWVPAMLVLLLMARTVGLEREAYFYRFGAGVHSGVFPVDAVEFIKRVEISGRMFNSYSTGGYLIWRLWPGHHVFIDGREDVYLKPGILEEYVHCFDSPGRWRSLVDKYRIDFAVVRYPESPPANPEQSLDVLAFPRPSWALIYFDDVVTIYARRNGKNDGIIQKCEIKLIQPLNLSGYLDALLADPDRTRLFMEEMQAHLQAHPSSFRDHFTLGMLAVKRGPNDLGEAVREFQRAAEINPDFAPAHVNLGVIYLHLGRRAEAEQSFKKALSLERNPFAEQQLRQLRQHR